MAAPPITPRPTSSTGGESVFASVMAAIFLHPAPQPGDGLFLLQSKSQKRRGRKKLKSFLVQEASGECEDEVDAEVQGPQYYKSFLQPSYEDGKEPTSSGLAPDRNVTSIPRTITGDDLLSGAPQFRKESWAPNLRQQQPLLSFLRGPTDPAYTLDNYINQSSEEVEGDAMALPPHMRTKKAASSKPSSDADQVTPGQAANNNDIAGKVIKPANDSDIQKSASRSAPNGDANGIDIRQKLQAEYGIKVTDPKPATPALVAYPSSNEDEYQATASNTQGRTDAHVTRGGKPGPATSSTGDCPGRRGSSLHSRRYDAQPPYTAPHRGTGRGRGNQGRQPRASRWPTAAETRADPHRWDIKWDEDEVKSSSGTDIDSLQADSGFGEGRKKKKKVEDGIDPDTGFKLTDWSGNWAPAPVDWDARPAFRDTQSALQIERWMTGIEEDMCGKDWSIPEAELSTGDDGKVGVVARGKGPLLGEIAPRYWIPVIVGRQAPQTFWNDLVKSDEPKPMDEEDLDSAKPWWERFKNKECNTLVPLDHPEIKGIDPDENTNERLARENDRGSNYHTENRKSAEKAKRDSQRERRKRAQEKARKISESSPAVQTQEKIKPGLNIYVRSARPVDVQHIREIYNHYVTYSVCTPETQRRTLSDMQQRYQDILANKLPFLVACERGGKIGGRRRKNAGEEIILPDKVVGFAIADDYNDMLGMYRFTAEVEVHVNHEHYLKGVAKCLLDKIIAMLDPDYVERGGFDTVGEELEGVGPSRMISNIIINLPYDKPERLEWVERWLSSWLGFKQVGNLTGIGNKEGKSVNLAIFQRTTGANIDATKPPIAMEYPS
ncbi:hypothetical protein LTR37_013526 [Vermiconidia calcicola]|uniref:Uncharacterized protein n=1 Tax=Vermiconidia calcicola TaxID=1690605 RepID=A0ACC3MXF0_9PEZI|nr:hypothetical protein LTR37_013526 [Vermiconidia calcicola]